MGTLANVEYARESKPWEKLVYDIKLGRNSILACAGYFSAALLEPAGISTVDAATGLVDVPDEINALGPLALFRGTTACVEIEGTMASTVTPVVYECWTQVHSRLKRLVVHPRLKDVNMYIDVEIYEVIPVREWDQMVMRERLGSRRKCTLSTDGKLTLDGSVANVSDRIAIRLMPAEPTLIRSTDFLLLMNEMKG